MNRTELDDLRSEFNAVMRKIEKFGLDEEAKSIVVKDDNGYFESLSLIIMSFVPRADYFSKRLLKVVDHLPKKRRKKSV